MTPVRRAACLFLGWALAAAPVLGAENPPPATPAPPPPAATSSSTTGLANTGARNKPRDPVEMAADALVARPAGLAATAVGAAIFVVALPFAAIVGDVKETGRVLVGAPAHFTFQRKLGELGGN